MRLVIPGRVPKLDSRILSIVLKGADLIKAPPLRAPDEWADQKRVLPAGSPEPGPWRSARTPYMIPVVRAAVDPAYRRIILVCGSQMGKTENVLNIVGQRLDDDPAPILYIGPTKNNIEKVIEPRVMKMIKGCDSLLSKLAKGKRNKTYKEVSGVSLRLGWAGSATELASQEAAYVLVDELDRMKALKGEGDIFALAEARISNYPDGKIIGTSTPTIGNVDEEYDPRTRLTRWKYEDPENIQSQIWQQWQEGTRFEWAWPCPQCHEYFIPRFSNLWWPKDKMTWTHITKEARIICPHCEGKITDAHKGDMNAHGVYVAPGQSILRDGTLQGDVEPNDTASFWISGLCSPWRPIGSRVRSFVAAEKSGDAEKIQVAVNTGLGQLFKIAGEKKTWESVRDHVADYTIDQIPTGVKHITTFVDVQKDRLIYAHRGWGYNMESWGLGFGELWGETAFDHVWVQLQELLEAGVCGREIELMGVDAGFRPGEKHITPENMVYAFARRNRNRVIATRGHDTQDKPVKKTLIDVTVGGKIYKAGLVMWHMNADYFKSWIYGRLDWPKGESGGFHLPEGTTDDYCMQLVAEARVTKPSGHFQWVRLRKDNHALDCEYGNVALAHILQVPLLRAPKLKPVQSDAAPDAAPPPPARRPMQRVIRRSGYMARRSTPLGN